MRRIQFAAPWVESKRFGILDHPLELGIGLAEGEAVTDDAGSNR